MKWARWHDIAELLGMVAIVASLLFVGLQMRQAQRIAMSERNASELANALEESAAVIAHADIWVKGNAGQELTPVEAAAYARLVRNANDLAYYGVQQQRLLGQDETAELDIAAYAGFLYENPGARQVWRTQESNLQKYRQYANSKERVTSNWVNAVESYLNTLEREAARTRGSTTR